MEGTIANISLSTPIFLPTGPFPCSEVVCAFGLGFSPRLPLQGGVGLEFIGRRLTKNLLERGLNAKNLGEITFSAKFVIACLPQDHLVIKKGGFPGSYTGRGPQNHFLTAAAKGAA